MFILTLCPVAFLDPFISSNSYTPLLLVPWKGFSYSFWPAWASLTILTPALHVQALHTLSCVLSRGPSISPPSFTMEVCRYLLPSPWSFRKILMMAQCPFSHSQPSFSQERGLRSSLPTVSLGLRLLSVAQNAAGVGRALKQDGVCSAEVCGRVAWGLSRLLLNPSSRILLFMPHEQSHGRFPHQNRPWPMAFHTRASVTLCTIRQWICSWNDALALLRKWPVGV